LPAQHGRAMVPLTTRYCFSHGGAGRTRPPLSEAVTEGRVPAGASTEVRP
jgi:hypothetical protein